MKTIMLQAFTGLFLLLQSHAESRNTSGETGQYSSLDRYIRSRDEPPSSYIPAYIPLRTTFTIPTTVLLVAIATLTVVGNTMFLGFEYNRKKFRPPTSPNASRRRISKFFFRSLVLSDLLAGVICCPLCILYMYFDLFNGDCSCRSFMAVLFVFQGITVYNLLIIGIERYLAVFHPLKTPSKRFARNLLILAWMLGCGRAAVITSSHKLERRDLEGHYYTLVCRPESTHLYQKLIHLADIIITFAASNIVLLYIAISVSRNLNQRKCRIYSGHLQYINKTEAWRFQYNSLFMNVIFVFSIPYSVYIVYTLIAKIGDFEVSFEQDFTARVLTAAGSFSNSALNPFVYYYSSMEFRRHVKRTVGRFWKIFSR